MERSGLARLSDRFSEVTYGKDISPVRDAARAHGKKPQWASHLHSQARWTSSTIRGGRNPSPGFTPQTCVPRRRVSWLCVERSRRAFAFLTLLSPRSALHLEHKCPRTSKRLSPSTQTALCQLATSWEDITDSISHTRTHGGGRLY